VPLAAGELTDDYALDATELSNLVEVKERAVDLDGSLADFFEEEDGAFEIGLPCRPIEPGVQQATLRCGDLALTSSRLLDGTITAEVARRRPDGTWLWVLDQPNINA